MNFSQIWLHTRYGILGLFVQIFWKASELEPAISLQLEPESGPKTSYLDSDYVF
jgi:hypothetical protein